MITLKAGGILSLDIGATLIKGVLGKEAKHGVKVEKAFLFNTPVGSVSDGHILDLASLGAEIHAQLETRKISTKQVIFSITSTEVVTRELLLPSVKSRDIRQMIVFEVSKLLPIQLEQYILDYSVLEKITEDSTTKSRVLVAAMPKEIAQGYWQLANQLNLKPLSLTIHACSIAQLFQQPLQLNGADFNLDSTTVFLDIGYHGTECNVLSKGNLLFHRTVNIGGKSFISENVFPDLAGESWIQEIRRVLWYYTGMNSDNKIDNIILTGGCTDIAGLETYVEDILKIKADTLESISVVSSDTEWEHSLKLYLNAIGAIKRK